MITIENNVFHLTDGDFSYAFFINEGKLYHGYYGGALPRFQAPKAVGSPIIAQVEFSEFGRGDFRVPSVAAHKENCLSTDFKVVGCEILPQKPSFGMPALRRGGETLVVTLQDGVAGLELRLYYTVFQGALARRAELKNTSQTPVTLDKFSAACFEFGAGRYETIDLNGAANRERATVRETLRSGIKTVSSTRGITSHQHSPFFALLSENATEESGEVFAFNLIYSGNFFIECEQDEWSRPRVVVGENILHGGIALASGESFTSPEVVSVYSANGLGEMSRKFHKLYRAHLLDPRFADKRRPIVINSWESVVFRISEEVMTEFIRGAAGLGIDMVVLDDGWFGKRDNDDCSLGDWVVDKRKLPNGLTKIIERCKENGMQFGLWFEPEAISPDSDLYRAHPDWAIATTGREGVQFRRQFVLNFAKKEVVDYVFDAMATVLKNNDISYVKWDMNRPITDAPNARLYHDFTLGTYDLYERLTKAFPNVLIEGCSGGGGRFDAGILYYSPMIWTSDNTDAWCRAKIQHATSLCFPLQAMSNHVSACPNIQTGRTSPFQTRGAVASLGALGYELHIAKATEADRAEVVKQTSAYKEDAALILTGDLYRLIDPFGEEAFCQLVVSEDKSAAYFVYVRKDGRPFVNQERVKLQGLKPNAVYRLRERDETFTGAELMRVGVLPNVKKGDYQSEILHIEEVG